MRTWPILLILVACRSDNKITATDPVADTPDTTDTTDCTAPEVPYNGLDDDCDPQTPDDDLDGDGFPLADDCDDTNAAVHPDAAEECNGVDDDCDGITDPEIDWYTDADADGWGGTGGADCEPPEGSIDQGGDCDDTDAAVNPGAAEVCNGIDDDCDKIIDDVVEGYGASAACPAVDCRDLLAVLPDTDDGIWWIGDDADTATDPFEARCDMTTDGGGWTLILSMNAAGMTQYDGASILEDQQVVGLLGEDNHLSEALYRVAFDESYVIDTAHGVAVPSASSWGGDTLSDEIDAQLAGTPSARSIWSYGDRCGLLLRSTETTDAVFADGDMRIHFMVNQDDTADIAFPVTTAYSTTERHLIFDSAFGYAGGRIYGDDLYDVVDVGNDEVFEVFVR